MLLSLCLIAFIYNCKRYSYSFTISQLPGPNYQRYNNFYLPYGILAPAKTELQIKQASKDPAYFPRWTYQENVKEISYTPEMEEITSLAAQLGFFQSAGEIYGGWPGFFDYGPLGIILKNNIKNLWLKQMIQQREDVVQCETTIIGHPEMWKASGHTNKFSDPLIMCKKTKQNFRPDEMMYCTFFDEQGIEVGNIVHSKDPNYLSCLPINSLIEICSKTRNLNSTKLKAGPWISLDKANPNLINTLPSPFTGEIGDLRWSTQRSLLFKIPTSHNDNDLSAGNDHKSVKYANRNSQEAYLRPETSQGIFTILPSIVRTQNLKLPFGIAQIGKSFRNEITPKHSLFRLKEFEQMEIEYFVSPSSPWEKTFKYWLDTSHNYLDAIGVDISRLKQHVHTSDELAHYAQNCTDILFKFPFGYSELLGVAFRASFDLENHQKHSGEKLTLLDRNTNKHLLPLVIEPSFGLDRLVLAVFISSLVQSTINNSSRRLLRFKPEIAPIKLAVFPLISHDSSIYNKARNIFQHLIKHHYTIFDSSGSVGRRYRKADEKGIPYCITVDYKTIEDSTFTIRDRDSTAQSRMNLQQLEEFLRIHLIN